MEVGVSLKSTCREISGRDLQTTNRESITARITDNVHVLKVYHQPAKMHKIHKLNEKNWFTYFAKRIEQCAATHLEYVAL